MTGLGGGSDSGDVGARRPLMRACGCARDFIGAEFGGTVSGAQDRPWIGLARFMRTG